MDCVDACDFVLLRSIKYFVCQQVDSIHLQWQLRRFQREESEALGFEK